MTIKPVFTFGDTVYLRNAREKTPGLVTGLHARPGAISCSVTWSDTRHESSHYAFELTRKFEIDCS